MSTLTIELSDEIAARLAAASEQAHIPASQIVEQVLARALPESPAPRKPLFDSAAHLAWLHKTWGDRFFSAEEIVEMRDFEDGATAR